MNAATTQEGGDREQLRQAVLGYQSALVRTMSSFATPPIRPVRIVLDKEGTAAALQPLKTIQEEAVRCLARAAGVDEQTAERSAGPLLKEIGVLALLRWDETSDVEGLEMSAPESTEELASRSDRLNSVAIDALIEFYIGGGHEPDDARFAETRRAWEAYDSQRLARFRKRRRMAASERHRAAWQHWGASQKV